MRRDKPPPWTLRLLLAENYYTASASGPSDNLKNPETLGLPTASREKPVCKGPSVKPTEVQKPIHNVKDQTRQPKRDGNNERERNVLFLEPPRLLQSTFAKRLRWTLPRLVASEWPATRSRRVVEADGIEPTTFCLQSRCSPN